MSEDVCNCMACNAERRRWWDGLTEREQKEIVLAERYVRDFNHGTAGHNRPVLIAKLAGILDSLT